MTATTSQSNVVVKPTARNERSLIAGMLQPYLGELAVYTGQKQGGNGRYQYPYLDAYWEEEGRHPFIFELGTQVIGFALIREVKGGTSVAEFFIKPNYRLQGHGRAAAHALFHAFPGRWAVRQQLMDADAQAFWRTIIGEIDSHYEERIETAPDGRSGTVQRFRVDQPTLLDEA